MLRILKNKLSNTLFYLSLLFVTTVFSQEKNTGRVPLIDILKHVESTFNISFSYADETIVNITIPPLESTSAGSIIEELASKTGLKFEKIAAQNYIIAQNAFVNLCGILTDINTNIPIVGATVNNNTISNEHGKFYLNNIPSNSVITIKHLGYKTFYIEAAKFRSTPCFSIRLEPYTQLLTEVVVHRYLTNGLYKQRGGGIEINTQNFGILPGLLDQDVLQTAQALPGVESINETVSNINIRGGTNDQNLLLWDGIKMYQSGHFFGLISAFNPHLTEKVVIIKNGTPAQYTDGVSGTIAIESYNSIKKEAFGGIGFNLISADGYAHIPLSKKLAVQVSARRSITDFLHTPTYNQFFDRVFQDSKITNPENEETNEDIRRREGFFFYDAGMKVLYDINEKHKFRGNIITMNNHLTYEETLIEDDTTETKQSSLDQQNLAFGGSLKSNWTDRFSTTITTYYTHYNLNARNTALETEQELNQKNEVLETGAKLITTYKLSNPISLTNGYQFYEVGISNIQDVNIPFFYSRIKNVVRNHALFSEIKYISPNSKTYLILGGRANYIEKFDRAIIEPRLSFNQKLTDNISLEVLGEMKNQVTNQVIDLQRDFLGVEKRRWILANNKDLPLTKSRQASVGINYNKESFYIGIEGFYKNVDGITTSNQGFQNQNQFERVSGRYKVKGLEFLINKKAADYSTWLSYTYNKNDYIFDNLTPNTFPNNLDVRHSISFGGTYSLNNLKLAMGLNWRSGKPYTEPEAGNEVSVSNSGNHINYENPNSGRLPEYFRADLSSNYKFKFNEGINGSVGLSVLNFLNRKNVLDTYYRLKDEQSTTVQKIDNVSLGITPNVNFRVYF